jgi:hypothetical protein
MHRVLGRRRKRPDEGPSAQVSPVLRFDSERDVSEKRCQDCGRDYILVKGHLFKSEVPHAVYMAACHTHDGAREAWIDLVLGTFGNDDPSDHITFGTRVGPVDGQREPAATLVQGAIPYGDSPIFGRKLTRDEALEHPRLPDCWEAIDFILMEDQTVHQHVYR